MVFLTEWRIKLRAKNLNGVCGVAHVGSSQNWVSQAEWARHGWTLNACSVRSLVGHAQVLTRSWSPFTRAPCWIWLAAASVAIPTGYPLGLSSVFIWHRVTLSDGRGFSPQPSMNVPVHSTAATAWESCQLMPTVPARCQGGHFCCGLRRRSTPFCLPSFFYLKKKLFSFCLRIFALISSCLSSFLLPPSLNLSFFSLLCTDTLVKSAYYALRWPCIAFYIRHKAVNGTEKREHMKREEGERSPLGEGSLVVLNVSF